MPRVLKNSPEAKEKMAHLRSLRKKKASHIEPVSDTPSPQSPAKETIEEPIVGTGKKLNSWIRHVQEFAKSNNMTYFKALKDPKLKETYKK